MWKLEMIRFIIALLNPPLTEHLKLLTVKQSQTGSCRLTLFSVNSGEAVALEEVVGGRRMGMEVAP